MFSIRNFILKYFCLYISQFVFNLWQLYIVDISMDILAKLNDFDALKERFESSLPLSALKKYFKKYFLELAEVRVFS